MFIRNKVDYEQRRNYHNALNGGENFKGFLDIQKKYGNSKAGQLASYYIGVIRNL